MIQLTEVDQKTAAVNISIYNLPNNLSMPWIQLFLNYQSENFIAIAIHQMPRDLLCLIVTSHLIINDFDISFMLRSQHSSVCVH